MEKQKKIRDTKLGAWLKEKAPGVLETVGDLLPDSGGLGVVKNLIDRQYPDLDPEEVKAKLDAEVQFQNNVTERWKADMNSDSWLSKNVRPLVLMFLVVCTMNLVFIDAGVIEFKVEERWINLLEITLLTVIGAYFGGRSIEKVRNTNKNETKSKGLFRKKEEK